MNSRSFIVSLSLHDFGRVDIKSIFEHLNYRLVAEGNDEFIFEKGNKLFTYVGLTNWEYVFRRVVVDVNRERNELRLIYNFSWLTNIGVLLRAAMPEIIFLKKSLYAVDLNVLKFR
ncbi:MAG: hypothetical protein QW076_03290 [Candidatus Anstonellales archaeon]